MPRLEALEDRRLLASNVTVVTPPFQPTSSDPYDVQRGPLANLGQDLVTVFHEYNDYVAAGSKGRFVSSRSDLIRFSGVNGTSVGIDVRYTGDFETYRQTLTKLGVNLTAANDVIRIVEGFAPIGQLPAIARAAQTVGGEPIFKPVVRSVGSAINQAESTLAADTARTQFNVDGTGQKIGVLSDSVNQFQGGLADSIQTGDLPNNIQVLSDGNPGDSDEGRAMLELIYDISPGATLAFATAFNGPVGFGNNIVALSDAGSNIIVDDVGYRNEPYYQDGVIQQGVNTVTSRGNIYLSAAGNSADAGYESEFRGVNATVPGITGAAIYQDFDPGAGVATTIPIQVFDPSVVLTFQFDQPNYTVAGVTSQVFIYLLDQNNNVASVGNANNVATQSPMQFVGQVPAGRYNVAIRVESGPAPGRVVFQELAGQTFAVSHVYGNAGGTSYPSIVGHSGGETTISVGAVPFFGAPPFQSPSPVVSDSFSSFGPEISLFTPDGTRKPLQILLKPDISAPQRGNTTFFGGPIDTTQGVAANPTFPGEAPTTFPTPGTPTNVAQNLPSFAGTSAAAPNLAAAVALMKQANPNASRATILAALQSSATPLNGVAQGAYSFQGGFGLAQIPAAITAAAAATLRAVFLSPGANQVVTEAPTFIQVQFNQPVNVATIAANALQVVGPNGETVIVGRPFGFDDPVFPTFVRFPITIRPVPGIVANGSYLSLLFAGTVTGANGQVLQQGVADRFTVADFSGPRITNTTFSGRIVRVTFDTPLDPASISPADLFLIRAGGVSNPLFNPSTVVVSQLNGVTFSYDPLTLTATIDLSALPQSALPTDHYGLVATPPISDGVGNRLAGTFNGVFPSGLTGGNGTNFIQDLGVLSNQPPRVSFLALTPQSDTGLVNDNNTRINTPSFIGQIAAQFPTALAGQVVYAQFNGIPHAGVARGGLNLGVGANGRGFTGDFDVQTVTDANGQFVINYPAGAPPLPEGQNRLRVVIVSPSDAPPFPGISSVQDTAFRIDNTLAFVGTVDGSQATSIPQNANINSLTNLSISIVDPVNPVLLGDPFAVDPRQSVPALDPGAASNVGNYRLFQVVNGAFVDQSSFIATAAYTSTTARTLSSDPFTGRINLTFAPGLPTGRYHFEIRSSAFAPGGITDAAGNAFAGFQDRSVVGQPFNYGLDFNLQPTPTYITSYVAYTPDANTPGGFIQSDVRSNYEVAVPGTIARAAAAPTLFSLDFSNPLNPNLNYNNAVQLLRSADSGAAPPDGDFGDLGILNTTGFTRVSGITVRLDNAIPGAVFGQPGFLNRLIISLPPGATLPPDYYRLYLPNVGQSTISDVFGSQLDGEFRGYKDSSGVYVNLLPNGQLRGGPGLPDLSGDGTAGGAFVTGFVVVPNGNILYARADALYNPQVPSLTPTGSLDRPYSVLAPEATFTASNGGDLNSVANSGANFNTVFDRSGDGQFEPSAFFAAQQRVQVTGGPAVVIALPSIPSRDPITAGMIQRPFVLQAPSGTDPIINDGSAAVPALTTLVFQPGTILKMQNASLFVQNQGSALQILGGPNGGQGVVVTSYKDSTIGGVSNNDPSTVGAPGDYGGIVLRNFSQAAIPGGSPRNSLFAGQIAGTSNPIADQRLKGRFTDPTNPASQLDAVSGADDVMSFITFLTERFAGGAVPQTVGIRYDGITLRNSRPTIVNSSVSDTNGPGGSAQAGISMDVDSLRADDIAQGPLIRNISFLRNGLNGLYIRAEVNGVAQPTDAVAYPSNPATLGGSRNFVLNNPYPYLLTSRMVIGQALQQETGGGQTTGTSDRLYINPGMILKFERGSALEIDSINASLNVGDRTYIRQFDADNNVGPTQPAFLPNGQVNPLAGQRNASFTPNSAGLAQVILTSLNDDVATTSFFDPLTQVRTTIVQPLPAVPGGSGALQPTPGNVPLAARWGNVFIRTGAVAVINSTVLRYGGGDVNTAAGTNPGPNPVLTLDGDFRGLGSRVSVTNNTFNDNLDVPITLQPSALLAADPQRPLASGAPFIHGNVFVNNGINGVGVGVLDRGLNIPGLNAPNLFVDSVWSGSDFSYILRDTIIPDGNIPNAPLDPTVLEPILKPFVTLTLQSTLAGTTLADGTTVASPGVPLLVKLQNPTTYTVGNLAPGVNPAPRFANSFQGGAGFLVGVDNGIDPPADSLIDPGAFSQIRILGIGANQTTGQTRVPVIITSIHDSTVGTTVNNVVMNQAIPNDTTAPARGDGGVIYFGGNMLTDYDLQDPRNGSLIDNADIKYITRIEQQGGGIIYLYDLNADNAFAPGPDNGYGTKLGYRSNGPTGFGGQYNQAKQLTISNSNLASFSDTGVFAHPGYLTLGIAGNFVQQAGIGRIASYLGEATHTYLVNNTLSDMPNGVVIVSETVNNDQTPSPPMAVLLNNTFFNMGAGIQTFAPAFNGLNSLSHVSFLAMDNIFSNILGNAAQSTGQNYGSDLQYNLFDRIGGLQAVGVSNNVPILGSPGFRNEAAGNFSLLPTSAAIDVARSELGPSIFGDMLYPASTTTADLNQVPTRSIFDPQNPATVSGSVNPFGGLRTAPFSVDIVTLPGLPREQRGFFDSWIPVLQTPFTNQAGAGVNPATFVYVPLPGERDQAGNLRVKNPNSANVGFGSRPFFDLGAFEYIIQNPPVVTSVVAVSGAVVSNLYTPGGISGTNQTPTSIQVGFNERLDPNTINGMSVILQASGGDGIFGNANSPADRNINLSGLLAFDPATNVLTISTAGVLANPATLNDQYRLILKGTGSAVIRDRDGLALDGFTANNTLPLPSGSDNFPGSDFSVSFTISTSSPTIVNGSFRLDPASDTSGGLNQTRINTPTFVGSITAQFPPLNAAAGQSVRIDISTKGDLNFDLIDAGVGTTDANGNFSVTLTKPIPDSPNKVGTNGIQGAPGSTYAIARLRVINQAGNASNLITDPIISYQAKGATAILLVDTSLPRISAFNPLANTVATVNANGGVTVSVTFNENIRGATLDSNSIQVFRSGGTGSFTGTTPIPVPIDRGSFTVQYLGDSSGSERVTFAIAGPLPNDAYQVVLKGTGASAITDVAGNPLSGAFTGTFPTGGLSNQGSDFVLSPFTVYSPDQANLIYVQAPNSFVVGTGTLGTRSNPFPTIAAGMAQALIGDNVLVLPDAFGGPAFYNENVVLKPGVRLLSAALASTDAGYIPGSANNTLIYGVSRLGGTPNAGGLFTTNNYITTVSINGAIPGVPTEISGFSIVSPLIGDPSLGVIDPTNTAISAINSDVRIDRNNIINAGVGIFLTTSGAAAPAAQVFDNVVVGNIVGIGIGDTGGSLARPIRIINNTIGDNTIGLANGSLTPGTLQAYVVNNIFFSNHDLTQQRSGTGIQSNTANTLGVGFNLFFSNGPSATSPADDAIGVFGSFVPSALRAVPDALGNFTGNPAFASPRDPRPDGDTPAVFFLNGNYDLTLQSVAINAANNSAAPLTDFLYRSPVSIPGKGFGNTGPASIGAYYFRGTGGPVIGGGTDNSGLPGVDSPSSPETPIGGGTDTVTGVDGSKLIGGTKAAGTLAARALGGGEVVSSIGGGMAINTRLFNVIDTSLSATGTGRASDVPGVVASSAAPSFIDINFSNDVNRSTASPGDLVLSGSGLDPLNPAKATGLAWIDDHAIRFYLSGGFKNAGTVTVTIPPGALTDAKGAALAEYRDAFTVASGGTATDAFGSLLFQPDATSTLTAFAQPVAVAGPVAARKTSARRQAAKAAQGQAKKGGDGKAAAKSGTRHVVGAKHPKAPAKPHHDVAKPHAKLAKVNHKVKKAN